MTFVMALKHPDASTGQLRSGMTRSGHKGDHRLPPLIAVAGRYRLAAEVEDYVDGSLYFDRISIKQIRFVTPGTDCIQGGLLQHRRTADNPQIFNSAGFGNRRLQDNSSLNAGCLGNRRVLRHGLLEKVAGHDAGGNAQLLRGCRFDDWWARSDTTQDAAHHAARSTAAHAFHAGDASHGRRSRGFLNLLDLFRDLAWRLQLVFDHLRLDLDLYGSLRGWWRGRGRWGWWGDQQGGHHLRGQRLWVQ